MAMKLAPLPEGNDSEHPFPLSIHGAWMFESGIEAYMRETADWYTSKIEDAYYCSLRTDTAIKIAQKLRAWAMEVDPEYLDSNISRLDDLLKQLASERERFVALMEEERIRRKNEGPD